MTEINRMNIPKSVKQGSLPVKPGEILLSDMLAKKLKIGPGDTVSLISINHVRRDGYL